MSFHKLSGKSATEQKEDRDRMINDLVNQGVISPWLFAIVPLGVFGIFMIRLVFGG